MSKVSISPYIAYSRYGNAYYILNTHGKLLSIDNIAASIFEKLLYGYELAEIAQKLHVEYEEDIKSIREDIDNFVNDLIMADICYSKLPPVRSKRYIKPSSYHALWEEAATYKVPLKVDIEITNACNHRCQFCYLELKDDGAATFIQGSDLHGLFKQLHELGTMFVTITGGEPMLHPEVFDVLQSALLQKLCVRLKTNGTVINDYMLCKLDELTQNGLLSVDLSIHSLKEAKFDNFTRKAGSYLAFMNNVEKVKESNIPASLVYNLTLENYDELDQIKDFAEKKGLSLEINPTIYPTVINRYTNEEYRLNKDVTESLIKNGVFQPKQVACFAARAKCWIDYTGNVVICQFLRKSAGNIKTNQFASIWDELINRPDYQRMLLLDQECGVCAKKGSCNICPGLYQLHGAKDYFCFTAECAASALGRANGD